jgi:hypothetical protein
LPDRKLQPGALYSSTPLGPTEATQLANDLNEIVPSPVTSACLFQNNRARFTAIIFAIPGRTDVDIWMKDWIGCPEVNNGVRDSGELINGLGKPFTTYLNSLASPAPDEN